MPHVLSLLIYNLQRTLFEGQGQHMNLQRDYQTEFDHPTRIRLIEITAKLLDQFHPDDIKVSMILRESLISKGSLYYHFIDVRELFEAAEVHRYVEGVNRAIDVFEQNLMKANSISEMIDRIKANTEWTQQPDRKEKRFDRIRILGRSYNNPRLLSALSNAQTEATKRITMIIDTAKERGFFKPQVDSKVFATFIQAYTLGKVVDDISANPTSQREWNDFINGIVIDYLFGPQKQN